MTARLLSFALGLLAGGLITFSWKWDSKPSSEWRNHRKVVKL